MFRVGNRLKLLLDFSREEIRPLPIGERDGVRELPTVLPDTDPLTRSFALQKRAALSPPGRGHERR